MKPTSSTHTEQVCWTESSGLSSILHTFSLAAHAGKVFLALGAILATLVWGTTLDLIWTGAGWGVDVDAPRLALTGEAGDASGSAGVFQAFSAIEMEYLRDAIESVRYGRLLGRGGLEESASVNADVGGHAARGVLSNVVLMGRAAAWMLRYHYVYTLFFVPVMMLAWTLVGGAICRMAAIEIARDEKISVGEAVRFARANLGNLFTAPLLPICVGLVVGVMLIVDGAILSIPWVGDLLGGLLFVVALVGGFVVAVMAMGTVAGGSLFCPAIAVEGSDAFDAVSRSFNYVSARPLRSLWYAGWLTVCGAFGWLFASFAAWLTAASTHFFVGWGSALASRPGSANKLTALWDVPTFESLHAIPGSVQGADWMAAGLIGLWVSLLGLVVWSLLASFYFSGSTVAFFLLRRDNDGTELSEIALDGEDRDESASGGASPVNKVEPGGDLSLPVINAG